MLKAEERVTNYISALKDLEELSEWHIHLIEDVYEAVKGNVVENLYMDIVSICVTSILSNKNTSYEILIQEVNKTLGLDRNDREVGRIKELTGVDAMYGNDEDSREKAISRLIEKCKCSDSFKTSVFLDVLTIDVNKEEDITKKVQEIANKYQLASIDDVYSVYNEMFEKAVTDLIVTDDVEVKEEEKQKEPYKSLVKMLTDPKK